MIGLYIRLAWRNVVRNRRRTALTVLAVFVGTLLIVVMGGKRNGQYAEAINAAVRRSVGHIQVQRKGYRDDRTLRYAFPVADADTAFIRALPHVEGVAPKLTVDALVGAGEENTTGAQVVGVIPSKERAMTVFGPRVMREGRFLDDEDTTGAVIGYAMAKNLKAGLGDELTLFTQARDGSMAAAVVTVRGIFRIGEPDMDGSLVLMHLALAQKMLVCEGRATAISLTVDDVRAVPAVKAALERRFLVGADGEKWAVLSYRELLPTLMQSISFDYAGDVVFLSLLLVVIGFGILNTVLMSVTERFHEFGVMMAVGVRRAMVGVLILLEAIVLALIGIAGGNVLGYAINAWWQAHPIRLGESVEAVSGQFGFSPILYAIPDLTQQALWSAVVFGLTLLVALWPMIVAMHFRPVEAIRQV